MHWQSAKNDLLAVESFPESATAFENRAQGYFCHFGANPYTQEDTEYHSFLYAPYAGNDAARSGARTRRHGNSTSRLGVPLSWPGRAPRAGLICVHRFPMIPA